MDTPCRRTIAYSSEHRRSIIQKIMKTTVYNILMLGLCMVAIFYMIVFMVIVRYRIDLGIILCVLNVWGFTTYVRSENQDDPAYEFSHRFWVILAMIFLIIGYIIISHPTASFVINDMLILALCVVILLFVPVFVSRVHHFWRDRDLVTRKNVRLFIRT